MIESISSYIGDHLTIIIVILIILFVTAVLERLIGRIIRRVVGKAARPDMFRSKRDEELREKTISGILRTTVRVVLWLLAVLLILAQLGINLGPLIAGAGIAGVAIGFGAQSLVKDMISGMFILLENQYRVGDVVEINQTVSGTVEKFTLRTTVLRNLDGMQQHIPNGEITLATNMTIDYANVNLDVGVSYDTDIDKVEEVVNKVGIEMAEDPKWKDVVIEAPAFLRVNDFGDSAVIVKITGKTKPMMQWSITGELRRRIKTAFDKNNIEIPFPQRVIHESNSKPKTAKK